MTSKIALFTAILLFGAANCMDMYGGGAQEAPQYDGAGMTGMAGMGSGNMESADFGGAQAGGYDPHEQEADFGGAQAGGYGHPHGEADYGGAQAEYPYHGEHDQQQGQYGQY